MPRMHEFAREERLPSYFMNVLQDFLSSARTDLRLTRKDATHVEVIPVEPYGIAGIDLQGLWRFRSTSVSRAHPGGGAGTYVVWAVGLKQDVVEVPKPFTDETDYDFDLRITSGANPAGEGVEVFEKIGEVDWDGAKITALRQTYNAVTGPMLQDGALSSEEGDVTWTRSPDGAMIANLKANSVTSAELADGSVDTGALMDLAVVTAKVAALAITESKLAENSVATAKIVNLAVTAAKLAAGAVIAEKIGVGAVEEAKIANLAVTAAKLAAEAVTEGKIANLAVSTGKLGNLAVTAAKIAEAAVEEAKIKDAAVTSRKAKLTGGIVEASGGLVLTEIYKDVPGAELKITPAVPSILKVTAVFTFYIVSTQEGASRARDVGSIKVDALAEDPRQASFYIGWFGSKEELYAASVAQVYYVPLTAAAHTIKMRAKKEAATNAVLAECGTSTAMLYELVAS